MQSTNRGKKLAIIASIGGGHTETETIEDKKWFKKTIYGPLMGSDIQFYDDDMEISNDAFLSMKYISLCPNIIISSSSFGWWAAYLSKHNDIIAPTHLYNSPYNFDPRDYYPEAWTLLENSKTSRIQPSLKPTADVNENPGNTSLGSEYTTVVTSYYKIPSKYNHTSSYEKWIENFMAMDFKQLSVKWPATARRRYVLKEFDNFESSKIISNWAEQEALDPELGVGHNVLLYKLWSEKVFMAAEVVESNPFLTGTFAWTDIGAFRDPSILSTLQGYPDPTKFNNSSRSNHPK